MSARRVVVVGADAAGMSAAHTALRAFRRAGVDVEMFALEETMHTSYSACGIPYWISGDVHSADELTARSVDEHRAMGIDMQVGARAITIDLAARTVDYEQDARLAEVGFDDLILATGAAPVVPPWALTADGVLIRGIHPVKNLSDGAQWISLLTGQVGGGRAVIVGGGYIGVEMAEAALRRGFAATLLTRSTVMSSLDTDMSERVVTSLTAAGIEVLTSTTVTAIETDGHGAVSAIVTDGGARIETDVVVLALGVRPRTELGAAAGLLVGEAGGYLIDEHGRVGEGVWAAGDCCEAVHRISGVRVFAPLGTHANKQGRVVGDNLAGIPSTVPGVLGTAITRFVGGGSHFEVARTGLSTREAVDAGFSPVSLVTDGRTASGYMPEARPVAVKVVADADSRLLLGAQIVGGQGSAKRIDTVAAALWGRLSIDDLAAMDLSYAPPMATVWEVVQLAARRLADRIPAAEPFDHVLEPVTR